MSDEHGHDHSHGHEKSSTRKLGVVSGINIIGFLVELIGGLLFGSIALMSDAFHMLFDATAYFIAFGSAYMAEKKDENRFWSFGYHRMETMAAFFNGALLIPMAGYILWESYQRFLNPVEIGIVPTLTIGFGGLMVNVISVYYLQGGDMSLNEKGAFYHLMGDTGGSIAVILSTLIIYFTGFKAADPIAALLIAGLITTSALRVLKESSGILLQKSPLDTEEISEEIENFDDVEAVEDLRIWELCSQVTVASLHVHHCGNREELKQLVKKHLKSKEVDHITLEMEEQPCEDGDHEIGH
ncbi:MAG: cation diffusion facilitator family transporter [Candidatus Nanohalobium sp.]